MTPEQHSAKITRWLKELVAYRKKTPNWMTEVQRNWGYGREIRQAIGRALADGYEVRLAKLPDVPDVDAEVVIRALQPGGYGLAEMEYSDHLPGEEPRWRRCDLGNYGSVGVHSVSETDTVGEAAADG